MSFTELAANYAAVMKRVRAAQKRDAVLIAVSKAQPAEAIEALYRLGHRDFGENYAQELLKKTELLAKRGCDEIRWHFIGHLQTNKLKSILPHVACIHSVDSLKLAIEISKQSAALRKGEEPLPFFIEVNIDAQDSKTGIAPDEAPALARESAALAELKLLGLMAVPSEADPGAAFVRLAELERRCQPASRGFLSMGMSSDFENALAHGSTHIRVGTAIFGPRN